MQWEKQLQKKYDCCRNEDMSSKRLTDQQRKFIHWPVGSASPYVCLEMGEKSPCYPSKARTRAFLPHLCLWNTSNYGNSPAFPPTHLTYWDAR